MNSEASKIINLITAKHDYVSSGRLTLESLNETLDFYESIIPEFFSKTGEAEGIRNLYTLIKENAGNENERTVCVNDMIGCNQIYLEYVEGMEEFIKQLRNSDENIIISENYKDKLSTAKENRDSFIDSLYNGKIREQSEEVLSEAVTNIEFLIDFIPELKGLKTICAENANCTFESANELKNNLMDESLQLLYESVEKYSYETLKTVFETYLNIKEVAEAEPEEEDKPFKLF